MHQPSTLVILTAALLSHQICSVRSHLHCKELLVMSVSRRHFLMSASAGTVGYLASNRLFAGTTSPNETVVIGVMGTSRNSRGGNGRGAHLAHNFAGLPNCEVKYVCDVDSR